MFKHTDGWFLNTQILKLCTRDEAHTRNNCEHYVYLMRVVCEEIAQDRSLVWC